eukprot:s1007_g13.t1
MPAKQRTRQVFGCAVLFAVLLASREQAFQSAQSQRGRLTALQAAADEGPGYEDVPPPRGERIQAGMRSKLMEEAKSLGDEETPISAGFGNPYLLSIVAILILGVASYFQLGLDKVASVKPTDVGDKCNYMDQRSSRVIPLHFGPQQSDAVPELVRDEFAERQLMASQEKDGQSRLKKLQKVIKDAFSCFDKQQKWLIEQDEVGVVMRYLGQFPSESDLKETIIPELLEEDPSKDGMVSFEAFERLMLRCLSDHTYDPDDSETLLAAFRVLDPQGHGYIDSNLMHEWLSTKGGKASDFFKERETSDFLEYAKDKDSSDSSRIYYEDYVAKLNADIEKHLENLYQAARGSNARSQ